MRKVMEERMRRFSIVLIFCLCSFTMYGQKPRFGQVLPHAKPGVNYPIKVHISGIHIRTYSGMSQDEEIVYADAVINAKKVECGGHWAWMNFTSPVTLASGEYNARILGDVPKMSGAPIGQGYEILLPQRIVWRCTVTGIFE